MQVIVMGMFPLLFLFGLIGGCYGMAAGSDAMFPSLSSHPSCLCDPA